MIQTTCEINVPITLTVKGPGTGLPVPPDLVLLLNGVINLTPVTFADAGTSALYNYTFTPSVTGVYTLHAYGDIQARVEVVTQSLMTICKNLQDEALGSWQWNKVDGTLLMLRTDGTTLANFAVVDNLTQSSRERTS